jgi:hypothetical protein
MRSRRWDNTAAFRGRYAIRAALLACCSIFACGAFAADITLDELSRLQGRERENALIALRAIGDADQVLQALSIQLTTNADARRDAGEAPLFPGCLRADEFELATQLKLAFASADGAAYRALASEYRRLTGMWQKAISDAQLNGNWRKTFSHLGRWISAWNKAKDPAVRELLQRTLTDQAIRSSLSAFQGQKVYFMARPTPALRAYDEYLFNLMCTSDEDNLNWLKDQVASNGWFDIRRYGSAADQAAWLMVQHADGAPAYQAYIAAVLEVKARSGETDPKNYAFLSDRVAVRAGQPQTFATQMECVNGEWIAPEVVEPAGLDARRASMGLPSYEKQIAKRRQLNCGKPAARAAQ